MEKDGYSTDVFIENVMENSGVWQDVTTRFQMPTPQLFAYRTDLPEGIPDTWEKKYREVAKSLTNKDKGYVLRFPYRRRPGNGGVFDCLLWSMGGAWADEDWNVTIDFSGDKRAALEHLKEIQDYADQLYFILGNRKNPSKHFWMEMRQSTDMVNAGTCRLPMMKVEVESSQ